MPDGFGGLVYRPLCILGLLRSHLSLVQGLGHEVVNNILQQISLLSFDNLRGHVSGLRGNLSGLSHLYEVSDICDLLVTQFLALLLHG